MDVSTLTSTGSSSSATTSATSSMMSNYDTFLTLLTTQLTNQNPLDPMDSDKFTEQLVAFSSVEQQIQTNTNLEDMLSALAASTTLNLVNYVGKEVTALSDTTSLASGSANWTYTLGAAPDTVEVTITNAAGAVVKTDKIAGAKGDNAYAWDGETDSGTTAPDGSYTISIVAKDAEGATVSVSTRTSGVVKAIDVSGTEPYLTVGTSKIPLSNVIAVGQ
ncbi:flagellar hook assembly protein FlgD [Methylobrevis pamukkalensis]|uniref:Basal-body rod modification protein FlgD n=1 Tax=Methylobrevis pamukkalensis TaxID=1439726 RepID=A0A1E3H1B0_9HYPH|nr:flagellar hook capping FlgD N-terminal domain-containing protein [Methylobrevis pamukkalensis]ODN70084.1 Basal-body rod modification protein FlgD [Methylobrevis pamukkalensis]